jgi:putative effector of murein hydrolase LrgA (UPF0299 family)
MGVWTVFARAGHMVALNQMVKRQAQNIFVKMTSLFCIPRTVSVMVQLQYFRRAVAGVKCLAWLSVGVALQFTGVWCLARFAAISLRMLPRQC